ncbi:hypothetical protein FSARC_6336 [Fusarium sarcochroum]|uniref:Uncharacterized protein n=1 Tax=Fusarium sarcochroum TaxID=1208366 RepID=A0A8H4TXL8_9HYPO|nr:hypothetical protein FSARC_6336 [Fusarium sarcochroum]
MAAKNQSSQSYQPLPRDDASAALLAPSERSGGEDGKPPVFRLTFSPLLLFRLVVIPLAITDVVFICQPRESPGAAAIFAIGAIFMTLWHGYRIFKSILPGKKSDKFDLKIGSFFCTFGTIATGSRPSGRALSYIISVVDFCFGLLLIGPSVLAFTMNTWRQNYWWASDHTARIVGALSITLVVLQSVIAFLNLFSLFRKMKIVVYKAEEEEAVYETVTDLFRDDVTEPRESMSSEV